MAATKWRFNGWAKYENHLADEAAGLAIPGLVNVDAWRPGLVLEGGSIDVNGAGLLLTTEECLLSPVQARNPDLDRAGIEAAFHDYLGVDRTLWLHNGIVGDDTHGHVDDLARFTDHESIVIVAEDDPADPNYQPLRENLAIAKSFPLRVRKLPMPRPLWFDGQRLPASYANFYIANRVVLVPTFNDPHDRIALNVLAECFPDREVTGIDCVELVWGLGTLHCMTQQQPAASDSRSGQPSDQRARLPPGHRPEMVPISLRRRAALLAGYQDGAKERAIFLLRLSPRHDALAPRRFARKRAVTMPMSLGTRPGNAP